MEKHECYQYLINKYPTFSVGSITEFGVFTVSVHGPLKSNNKRSFNKKKLFDDYLAEFFCSENAKVNVNLES